MAVIMICRDRRSYNKKLLLLTYILVCPYWFTSTESATDVPRSVEYMEWKFHRNLYDYRSYGAITLERIDVPLHTIEANVFFTLFSSSYDCEQKQVKIYANQHGLPMVSRDGEAFPNNSYVQDLELRNVTVTNNNITVVLQLTDLSQGFLFLMAVMPPPESRIKQQGLGMSCDYFLTVQSKISYFLDEDIPQLMFNNSRILSFNQTPAFLLSLKVPVDVVSYTIHLGGCDKGSCPMNVSIFENLNGAVLTSSSGQCAWIDGVCTLEVKYPIVDSFNYIFMKTSTPTDLNISISAQRNYFNKNYTKNEYLTQAESEEQEKVILVKDLGRETPASAEEGSNFYDYFVDWDQNYLPQQLINFKVLDVATVAARFKLRTSDTGSTLKLIAQLPVTDTSSWARVQVCVSPHRISEVTKCTGLSFNVTNKNDANRQHVYVPYPQSGFWFVSLKSQCYVNTSKEVTCVQSQYPIVNLTVHLSPCIDGGCGAYGSCKLYFGADLLYSACNCFSGWRGYGCNDGSRADSSSTEKASVYLLTLSNLGFVPGIALAIYRRLYVEALVYSYNMFFSTFYHACDTSEVYKLCIMPYNALSFADFFASLLSFWVTLMAMARIPGGVRSFLHMLSALLISLGEVYDRHGLVEQLLPIVGGVAIVLLSWVSETGSPVSLTQAVVCRSDFEPKSFSYIGYECYKRKSIFPSKKRLLYFICPGIGLACVGLILNLAVETVDNYKYIHSLWHILESASILFLLPPKRGKTGMLCNLSVQSGDITRQRLLDDDELEANLHRADQADAAEGVSEPSSPPETPKARNRGFKLRKVLGKSSQNLVL